MGYAKHREALLEEFNRCCAACGNADVEALDIDHCTSQRDGGSDDYDNLQILCHVCNAKIKNRLSTPRLLTREPVTGSYANALKYINKSRREYRIWCSKIKNNKA